MAHERDDTPTLAESAGMTESGLGESEKDKDLEEAVVVITAPAYPDGGATAYKTTLGGVLVLFSMFGTSNAFGAFQAEFERNQLKDYSPGAISWVGSVHLFILFTCGLASGRLFDSGYFQYQLAVGSTLWIIGIFMLSLSKTYVQVFLSFAVCMGFGLGAAFTPTLSCVGSYFLKKRSMMMSCTACGAAMGALCFPIILNHLIPKQGFGAAVRAVAYLQTAALVIANLLMRPRKLPKRPRLPMGPQIVSFLRQPSTWLVCLGCFGVMIGLFIPIFYVQVYAEAKGASPVVIQYSVAIINGAAIFSRLGAGVVGDRIGVFTAGIPVIVLTGVMILMMLAVSNGVGVIIFCVFYGLASGGWISLMAPAIMSLAQDVQEIGVRAGLGFLFIAVATLLGSPVAGFLLRAAGSYWAPCTFGGVMVLLGATSLFFARRTQVKRKGTWRV